MAIDPGQKYSVVDTIRQSPPLDLSTPVDDAWVKDKTILITGGASGFGEGFFRRWAAGGATVVIGDITVERGDKLVRDVARETGNKNLHFLHCDVTDWQSQVDFFKAAVKISPHKGIDCVVANAGKIDTKGTFENPRDLDSLTPPTPAFGVLDVNLKGAMYTTHLALFWLPRNPSSIAASPTSDPVNTKRDRHLLFISSLAGIGPIPGQTEYTASKHALVGLYRSLRATTFRHGVRINMLCPSHIATPLQTAPLRMLLAGGSMGECDDVVEAATRFVASPQIVGRALLVGPKMSVESDSDGHWSWSDKQTGEERAMMEIFAHDWEETETSQRRVIRALNKVVEIKGWTGWFVDVLKAIRLKRKENVTKFVPCLSEYKV
ncbi:uncharacterized protein KY384_001121 [Bacidia gigantensis]|uniref:uncharacterized protein n=1 Tax=Bacidia gigantensis TaxID=2732470 RepID=UPI001D04ECD2|nr:uncharacterized protein KY384_001121 [Bacidia gigantensis]KAG8534277.1 hypothetical protein KY384_001121 [Bacidia gigantensis]